ncbi:MAG: cytochrome B [Gammaproteobacteria bacterium]|nr:MAG: cytochrome B [Gammaproteobacteria bacterium]
MQARIHVWDIVVRVFHWGTVGLFAALFVTGEGRDADIHAQLGYALGTLLFIRVIWGFVGTHHARFRNFLAGPQETICYLKSLANGRPKHYTGHNPAGAAMVVALLLALTGLIVSGLFMEGGIEFEGPLSGLGTQLSDNQIHWVREIHESLVILTLGLISLHIAGVIVASLQHNENLVHAMITGYKTEPRGDHHASQATVSEQPDEPDADWQRHARSR